MAVFLAADREAWHAGQHDGFWQALRLAVLYFLWVSRCRGRERHDPVSALAVVAQVVHHLRARIREDALRAFCTIPDYGVLGGEWLPDRPPLDPSGFHARWSYRGILCCTAPGSMGVAGLDVRLTLTHPVLPPS